MTRRRKIDDAGFTLIESMVALVILGIAAVGIIRAVEAHVDGLRQLDQRTAARWVAENALAEARLGLAGSNAGSSNENTQMLQYRWTVTTRLSASEDPDLDLATIEVTPQGSDATMIVLRGFVDTGRVTI